PATCPTTRQTKGPPPVTPRPRAQKLRWIASISRSSSLIVRPSASRGLSIASWRPAFLDPLRVRLSLLLRPYRFRAASVWAVGASPRMRRGVDGVSGGDVVIGEDVQLAPGVVVSPPELVTLYGCRIGARTRTGSFVEIQKGASIGADCKVSSHTFVCEGVTI